MAEKKDPITLYAEAKGITRAQAITDLEGIDKGFTSLYEKGDFSLMSEDESSAHRGLAASFKSDPLLLRAFDTFRKSQGEEGVQETLASANDTWNISDFIRRTGDALTGGDTQESFEKALYEPYGFTKSATGSWTPPYQQKQAAKADTAMFNSVAPVTDKEVDDLEKKQAAAPAPQNQAQAGRPTLDQPDGAGATSAAALAAAQGMPDFVNRLGGNARWANQAKAQMMQEAKRRQQNEIAELKKSEKARKRAGEVDEILNAKNDQYRQLYANTPDAEGNARSAEDWDAMDRDQKIKLIQNYNTNRSLDAAAGIDRSLDTPAGEVSGQMINAQVAPRGSMEDLTTPRQFNEVTQSFEIPQEPRQFDSSRNTFRTPTEVLGQNLPEVSPESFEPQVRTPESPDIDMEGIQSQVDAGMDEAMRTRRRQKPEIPSGAVHTRHPNVPKDSHTGIYATNPGVQQRAFDLQLENDIKNTIPYENNIDDSKSTKVTPPPGVTVKPEPVPQKSLKSLLDDPVYQQNVAKRNPVPQAPAQPSKLPAADPFLQDEPQKTYETEGPKRMVKVANSDGSYTWTTYEDQKRRAQEYAKKQMRNSPFSSLGNAYSGRMSKLYPTLNTDRLKKEVDQETADYYSKNNPFGEEYRPKGKRYNPFA